jgi:4'-phosphopantetheinyl transferase
MPLARAQGGVRVNWNCVQVRWLNLKYIDPAKQAILKQLLDDRERSQALRLRFERDRMAYIAAHALVRTMLLDFASVPPSTWRFVFGPAGRPELVIPPGLPRLNTSLSHTRGLAAAAVTIEHDIGVDVERVEASELNMALAPEVLATTEVNMLTDVPETDRNNALFAIWTLKEAYVKALGVGLQDSPACYAFTLDPIALKKAHIRDDGSGQWLFRCLAPSPEHKLAIAVRYKGRRPKVIARHLGLDAFTDSH